MKRKYHIGKDNVLKTFMYSHHQSCGWDYCLLICDGWKYRATLKDACMINPDATLNDYLLIEAPTLDACMELAEKTDVPCSVWDKGRIVHSKGNCKE